ncbi:hypothetical protein AB205_0189930 [Aquarana catesbeiana]|uniref:COP9 signalosome complex subunit 9 n=1 Tax=Aquarana catesbeiana TaxID=8400 RepID=A0A2G9RFB6_AQUCT|nr:hypothetical protein AB205_0189930 [Aquarana catesbeiana]
MKGRKPCLSLKYASQKYTFPMGRTKYSFCFCCSPALYHYDNFFQFQGFFFFIERKSTYILLFVLQAGGSTGLLMDLAANEKAVHLDYFNNFGDLFDDDDID